MGLELLILALVSIMSAICGFGAFVLWDRNRHARSLSLLLFSSASWTAFIFLFLRTNSELAASAYVPAYYISSALLAIFGLGFAISYSSTTKALRQVSKWLVAVTVPLVIGVVAFCTWPNFLILGIDVENHTVSLGELPYAIYSVFISGCFLLATVFFVSAVRKKNISLAVRTNLKRLLFLWLAGGLIAVIFNLWLPLVGNYSLIWVGPLGMIFAISIAFVLATTVERFSPLRAFLKGLTNLSSLVVTFFGAFGIFALLFEIAPGNDELEAHEYLAYIVSLVAGMLWSWLIFRINGKIMGRIDANDYDESEILSSMSQIASKRQGMVEFFRSVRHTLDKTFGVDFVDIIVFDQNTAVHVKDTDLEGVLMRLANSSRKYGTIYREDVRDKTDYAALLAHNIEVVTPIVGVMDKKVAGVIVLSPRKRRFDRYYGETLLKVSVVLSPFIQSAVFYEQINNFNLQLKRQVREKTQELRESNEELMKLDELKDDLLSIASHNLRTPLTGIIGYADMLSDGDFGKLKPEQTAVLDEIVKSGKHMSKILADFLNVTRIDSGRLTLKKEPINLVEVAEEEVANLKEIASQYGRELVFTTSHKKIKITGDELRIRQAIANLIDNAIYYGRNRIEIEVSKSGEHAVLTVRDDGVGVPKKEQAKLFTKMYRATNAKTIRPDGSGIGLYVVKSIVEDSGGKVIFESEEGGGSMFGFRI